MPASLHPGLSTFSADFQAISSRHETESLETKRQNPPEEVQRSSGETGAETADVCPLLGPFPCIWAHVESLEVRCHVFFNAWFGGARTTGSCCGPCSTWVPGPCVPKNAPIRAQWFWALLTSNPSERLHVINQGLHWRTLARQKKKQTFCSFVLRMQRPLRKDQTSTISSGDGQRPHVHGGQGRILVSLLWHATMNSDSYKLCAAPAVSYL